MIRRLMVVVALVVPLTGSALALDVKLGNRSRPAACAEVDNVDFRFRAPVPIAFRLVATFPEYHHADMPDHTAPVWDNCEGYAAGDPVHRSDPGRQVVYEDAAWLLVGVREASFWRPATVPVRVGGERFGGLHYVQLHRKRAHGDPVEVLVLYPPDGYWRPKPLAPAGHEDKHGRDTAFGSSFLIGPIQEDGRPFVDLTEVTFLPARTAFELRFNRGGTATVEVAEVAVGGLVLDVRIEREDDAAEIAALRSMFVEPTMADTAVLRWSDGSAGGESDVLAPFSRTVESAAFVRTEVSRHNTSAPDLRFTDFRRPGGAGADGDGPPPRRP